MTINRRKDGSTLPLQSAQPVWGDFWDDLHASPPKSSSGLMYVGQASFGMFDQGDIYPHLITEVRGCKVAVPLGHRGEGWEKEYQVEPFHYQPLPQKELHWGWWFPILRVKLRGEIRRRKWIDQGSIRIVDGGGLELCCTNPRGVEEWLPIPNYSSRKPAGAAYARWEIFVGQTDEACSMVRFDGLRFAHWPEP